MATKAANHDDGQALVELVLIMPIFLVLLSILYRSNLIAQVAINNAQFARTQTYVLAHNSPEYPRVEFRRSANAADLRNFSASGSNRMVLAVVDPKGMTNAGDDDGEGVKMIPTEQFIARKGTETPGSDAAGEVTAKQGRTKIRVRGSAEICTQSNYVIAENGKNTYLNSDTFDTRLRGKRWPFDVGMCPYGGKGSE